MRPRVDHPRVDAPHPHVGYAIMRVGPILPVWSIRTNGAYGPSVIVRPIRARMAQTLAYGPYVIVCAIQKLIPYGPYGKRAYGPYIPVWSIREKRGGYKQNSIISIADRFAVGAPPRRSGVIGHTLQIDSPSELSRGEAAAETAAELDIDRRSICLRS
jgi:hypothetical protein